MEAATSGSHLIQRIPTRADLAQTDLKPGRMYELEFLKADDELLAAVKKCCDAEKRAAEERLRSFVPSPDAARNVAPEALDALLASGAAPSDSVTDPQITDYILFHTTGTHALFRQDIVSLRRTLDRLIAERLRDLFPRRKTLAPIISGQFLYPPGSHLGWHTNVRVPGWRLYIVHVEDPGRSFFRYRDVPTGEIVTAWDDVWNIRLVNFDDRDPFWHAVYSDTFRFSFGYRLDGKRRRGLLPWLASAVRRLRRQPHGRA
jgi:hypothetical protein